MENKPDYFGWFEHCFTEAWDTEYLSPHSEIKKRKFYYEVKPNVIYIYLWNKQDVIARMEPIRCWMDNSRLRAILLDILPEFSSYFQGNKNFITHEWEIETE